MGVDSKEIVNFKNLQDDLNMIISVFGPLESIVKGKTMHTNFSASKATSETQFDSMHS